MKPKITALCSSFDRPELIGRLLECFRRQTYENRELLILDDTTTRYGNLSGDRWRIISLPKRALTLSENNNFLIESSDSEYLAVWDDDDVYFPHALESCVDALQLAEWAVPSVVYEHREGGLLRHDTSNNQGQCGYHGSWCYRKTAAMAAGLYPILPKESGEDRAFGKRMLMKYGKPYDTLTGGTEPYYIFCRNTDTQDEDWPLGEVGYVRKYGELPAVHLPTVTGFDTRWQVEYESLPVLPGLKAGTWHTM